MTKLEQFVEGLRKRANVNPAGPASLPATQIMPGQTQSVQQPTPSAPTSPGPTTRQGAAASPVPPPAAPTGSPMPQKPQLPTVPAPGATPRTAPMPKAQLAKAADRVPGGKGDGKPDAAFNPKQLRAGVAVEKEHSPDKEIRKEISKDHLTEHSDYYSRLASIEPDAAEALKKAELISVLYKAGACGRKKHKKMSKKACLQLIACASDKLSAMRAVSLLKSAESDADEYGLAPYFKRMAIGTGIGGGLGALYGAAEPAASALHGMAHDPLSQVSERVMSPGDREFMQSMDEIKHRGARLNDEQAARRGGIVYRDVMEQAKLGPAGSVKRLRSAIKEKGLGPTVKGLAKSIDMRSVANRSLIGGVAGAYVTYLYNMSAAAAAARRQKLKERKDRAKAEKLSKQSEAAVEAQALAKPTSGDDGALAGAGRGALLGAGLGGGLGAAVTGAAHLRGMSKADLSKTLQKTLDPADKLAILKYFQREMSKVKPTAEELFAYTQALGKTERANMQLGAPGSFKRLRSAVRERGLGAAAKDTAKLTGRGALRGGIAGAALGGTGMLLAKLLSGRAKTEEQKPGEA